MSINHLSFNSLTTNLTCCTDQGYIVYSLQPLEKKSYIELNGGAGMARIYANTNMMVLVGGGTKPFKSRESFILYDQLTETAALEIDMKESIKNILITKTNIVVVLEKKISVFNWDGVVIDTKLTYYNPNGLCVINSALNTVITLGIKKGEIAVWEYTSDNYKTIEAHQTNIEAIAISYDGLSVATSSETGTLVRVYDTKSKLLKGEFRRGTSGSTIYDLAFNYAGNVLACCSNHGTVHLYDLNNNSESRKNKKSFFTGYGSYLSTYFNSEWGFKQIPLQNTSKAICSFDENNNLHIVTYDGSYYKIGIDKEDIGILTQGNLHINNK
jgi:WD40 repeat protein